MATPGEKDPLSTALGRAIAIRRQSLGFTQEGLAYRCKLHPTTISQVERGINSPTVRVLHMIAKHLSTRVSTLLIEAEEQLEGSEA